MNNFVMLYLASASNIEAFKAALDNTRWWLKKPVLKNMRGKMDHFQQFRDEHKKIIETTMKSPPHTRVSAHETA